MSLRSFLIAFTSLMVIIIGGMLAFHRLEGMSYFDALWLTVISITTVGYGDKVAQTIPGRIATIVLIISGMSLFTYVLSTLFAVLVEGRITDVWGKKRMQRAIGNLKNHIVVCGAGRVGREVLIQLKHDTVPFVFIEKNSDLLEMLQAEGVLYIAGDATEDRVLLAAGVERAQAVIITLPDDAGNMFITITTKDFNPGVRVIARANRPEAVLRLKRAGADHVISPAAIGGHRMAMAALKPASVALVQTLIERPDVSLDMEEIMVCEGSPLAYRELRYSRLREAYNTQLLAIVRGGQTIVNPAPTEKFQPDDLLVVFGPSDKLVQLEEQLCKPPKLPNGGSSHL